MDVLGGGWRSKCSEHRMEGYKYPSGRKGLSRTNYLPSLRLPQLTMSSFFVLPPHAAPASLPHHPPLALPIPDPQLAPPSLAPYPTSSIPPLHSHLHHSAHAAPIHDVFNPSTNALHDHSAALGVPRPRKKTSSVSKAIKAKKAPPRALKPPHNCVQGVKLASLQHPLQWVDIPCLGRIIPGPDPTFLSRESFSEDALPRPGWLDFAL